MRWLPNPLLSAALCILWLLLNGSTSAGHLLLGILVGWVVPWLMAPLRPYRVKVARPGVLLRLLARVAWQGLGSNLQVAWQVLQGKPAQSAFVRIPLALHSAHSQAALAVVCAAIPGTVWARLEGNELLMHVLNLGDEDEAAFIARFKADYEKPLLEIFP